jgi:hypothetical protein
VRRGAGSSAASGWWTSTPPLRRGGGREDTGDESFVLGAERIDSEDVGDDGYWWWQSTEAKAARWVMPQWEVLAVGRGEWRAVLKGMRVNDSEV